MFFIKLSKVKAMLVGEDIILLFVLMKYPREVDNLPYDVDLSLCYILLCIAKPPHLFTLTYYFLHNKNPTCKCGWVFVLESLR